MLSTQHFDHVLDRRGTGCMKWDNGDAADVLEMWVADMDFPLDPRIQRAVQRRLDHGVFGYTSIQDDTRDAIVRWYADNYGWEVRPDEMIFTPGVVPSLSAIIKACTKPGDAVLALTPVYNCFFSSIRNNGCQVVECPLAYSEETYTVDYEAMERAIEQNNVKLFLLCNPHNPAGRVWSPEELRRVGDICARHDVLVVADEAHSGIIMPGHEYYPYGKLGENYMERCVVASSPSKSFNFAGLQISYIICRDSKLRNAIDRAVNINEVCDVNPLGVEALKAAYTEAGFDWLDALNSYIQTNYNTLKAYAERHWPRLRLTKLEGTYLAWLNIEPLGMSSRELCDRLLKEARVRFTPGIAYGKAGEGFIRINLACPKSTLEEALRRVNTVLSQGQ